jgi:hypothetical protein
LDRLVRSLNLPPDSLSAALVSFARRFSLPLDQALLTRLRREALSLNMSRESAALAAVAAAAKGVGLTPEALEKYTAAIDPDARREQSGADSQGGGQGRERSGRDGRPPENSGEDEAGDRPGRVSVSGIPDAGGLGKIRDDIDGNDPLLRVLNSIPGKDGERWMVYPFQVSAGGKRFLVSMRVTAGNGGEGARLAVDVAGEDRRWLFVLDQPASPGRRRAEAAIPNLTAGDAGGTDKSREFRSKSPYPPVPPMDILKSGVAGAAAGPEPLEVRVSLWPPPGRRERESLEREIREALGLREDRVILRDSEPVLAECRNEVLFSINEEV